MLTDPTKALFGKRAADSDWAVDYVDWACEMLYEGHDTLDLKILAGFNRHDSVFDARDYFNRAIRDLGIAEPTPEAAVLDYAQEIASGIVQGRIPAFEGASALYGLWTSDCDPRLIEWVVLDDEMCGLLAGGYSNQNLNDLEAKVRQAAKEFLVKTESSRRA